MPTEIELYQLSLVLFSAGALLALIVGKPFKGLSLVLSSTFSILASFAAVWSSILTISQNSHFRLTVPLQIPLGMTHLSIDSLSAFFTLIIAGLAIPVSIYSVGYLKAEYLDKPVGVLGALYNLFLLSMILVVSAGDGFLFLLFWECMTILSFACVVFDTKSLESQKAGFIYLLMTHVGSAFLILLFIILSLYSGSFSFESFHHLGEKIPEGLRFVLFLFALIGFGTKAGIVPLHIWLPEAHPAAPSHISALMSGVMVKTAVYGFLRCTFDFLAPVPFWWGMLVVGIAMATAFLGIIYASVEDDLKRLLAYSSIENMGIILLPIGLSMVFYSLGENALSSLALIAGLFHTLNHAVFKGLMFLGAGSILSVTHTRNLDRLGGLIKSMPRTALFFLIGALAISALPPLNGFLSEWLIFQSMLLSFNVQSQAVQIIVPICAAILGLIGAIAAMTFVKAFSMAFLALPRSHHAKHAHEVSFSMQAGMLLLAFLCVVLGITPFITLPHIAAISQVLTGTVQHPQIAFLANGVIQVGDKGFASLSTWTLFFLLLGFIPFVVMLPRLLGVKTPSRREWTWSCGVTPSPEFEYTPAGFSQPLEVVFSKLHTPDDIYHKYIYLPAIRLVMWASHGMNPIQSGSLQLYLAYIFVTLILCIMWVR